VGFGDVAQECPRIFDVLRVNVLRRAAVNTEADSGGIFAAVGAASQWTTDSERRDCLGKVQSDKPHGGLLLWLGMI
jgi:hypothetical protein